MSAHDGGAEFGEVKFTPEVAVAMRRAAEHALGNRAWWHVNDIRECLDNLADVGDDTGADAEHIWESRPAAVLALFGALDAEREARSGWQVHVHRAEQAATFAHEVGLRHQRRGDLLEALVCVAWADGAEAGAQGDTANPYLCHCGTPVAFGFDGDPTNHRGMCARCDAVRCDAHPGACDLGDES